MATHILEALLARGHSVVTTVRSSEKAQQVKSAHSQYGQSRLDFAIVEDVAQLDGALRSYS